MPLQIAGNYEEVINYFPLYFDKYSQYGRMIHTIVADLNELYIFYYINLIIR
jgi:hypothetical protein